MFLLLWLWRFCQQYILRAAALIMSRSKYISCRGSEDDSGTGESAGGPSRLAQANTAGEVKNALCATFLSLAVLACYNGGALQVKNEASLRATVGSARPQKSFPS